MANFPCMSKKQGSGYNPLMQKELSLTTNQKVAGSSPAGCTISQAVLSRLLALIAWVYQDRVGGPNSNECQRIANYFRFFWPLHLAASSSHRNERYVRNAGHKNLYKRGKVYYRVKKGNGCPLPRPASAMPWPASGDSKRPTSRSNSCKNRVGATLAKSRQNWPE